ncbi:MAG TPA: hypothetical protein VF200_02835, partial [Woeseiaceae bacterium]
GYSGWIRGDLPYARIAWVGPAADGLRIFAAGRKGVVALWLHTDGKRWPGRYVDEDRDVAFKARRLDD